MRRTCVEWIKKEAVLSIAVILALLSCFVVRPDREYLDYIDFRTLGILFCLMAVMAGFQKIGVFGQIAKALLKRVKTVRMLVLILVLLCFFFSMVITNDVALITFVPLTFIVRGMTGEEIKKKVILPSQEITDVNSICTCFLSTHYVQGICLDMWSKGRIHFT